MINYQRHTGKHGFIDYLISGYNEIYFMTYEPLMLRFLRMRYETHYQNKNENPLVTVYIPTYNRAELLMERSLPTVLAQTYKNLDILIIGDRCTDKTKEYVTSIKDPRIRFYNIPKRGYRYPPTAENHWLAGPVVAANTGLKLAKGKWIARIDDDDRWEPEFITTLLKFAQENNYEFVSSACVFEKNDKETIVQGLHARDPYYSRLKVLPRNPGPRFGSNATWIFRRYLNFVRYNIHCWRKTWNRVNDIDYSLRMAQTGARMGYIDKALLRVCPRPGEQAIGLEAYMLKQEQIEKDYYFDK
ncbi:MAG: glycosyltransferase family 2 protein [Candidatus Omnitrophica bacterium]|nr:glycosyltransferase family 2 protein [Candidatus Omnitrophota bacterium]